MTLSDHVGISNTFVTSTLGASVSALAGGAIYASSYPLFRYTSSTKISFGTLSMAGSSISNV